MRKAFFPGVVSASPTVCTQKARKVTAASTSPALRHGPFSVPASERRNTAAMSSPVRKKRTPMSWAGGSTSTASFITTKANPQIMVAANSMSLYTKPGYVSSQSQPAIIVRPFAFRQVTASQRGRNGILLTGVGVHGGRMMVGKR